MSNTEKIQRLKELRQARLKLANSQVLRQWEAPAGRPSGLMNTLRSMTPTMKRVHEKQKFIESLEVETVSEGKLTMKQMDAAYPLDVSVVLFFFWCG